MEMSQSRAARIVKNNSYDAPAVAQSDDLLLKSSNERQRRSFTNPLMVVYWRISQMSFQIAHHRTLSS